MEGHFHGGAMAALWVIAVMYIAHVTVRTLGGLYRNSPQAQAAAYGL